jgi:hypothetical protein
MVRRPSEAAPDEATAERYPSRHRGFAHYARQIVSLARYRTDTTSPPLATLAGVTGAEGLAGAGSDNGCDESALGLG